MNPNEIILETTKYKIFQQNIPGKIRSFKSQKHYCQTYRRRLLQQSEHEKYNKEKKLFFHFKKLKMPEIL